MINSYHPLPESGRERRVGIQEAMPRCPGVRELVFGGFFYLEFATLSVLKILLLTHFFLDLSCPSYVPRDPFSASRLALG